MTNRTQGGGLRTSLLPSVCPASRGNHGNPAGRVDTVTGIQVGDKVDATVEMLKDGAHYLVASLPGRSAALGFAALRDVNTFGIDAGVRFELGQSIKATVASLPDAATGIALRSRAFEPIQLLFVVGCMRSGLSASSRMPTIVMLVKWHARLQVDVCC